MGQEIQCRMLLNGQEHSGKALLETGEIIFRGDVRLKISRSGIREVTAEAGQLRVLFDQSTAIFDLGQAAPRWAEKILNPPTRAAKFGIRNGATFMIIGPVDADFLLEIKAAGASETGDADIVLLAAPDVSSLAELTSLQGKTVWVIYPKGIQALTELDVIKAGRNAGLVDVKVVGFSASQTALKFVPSKKK